MVGREGEKRGGDRGVRIERMGVRKREREKKKKERERRTSYINIR